jgi:integrase
MQRRFTDLTLQNLKAGDVRREIPIPGAQGLYCVIQPSGKKSFAVRYRFNGKTRKLTLSGGVTLKGARKLAGDALLDLERGRDPAEDKKTARQKIATARAETVQWLCEQYLKREGSKLRTAYERERELKRLVYIGDTPLADLKRSTIVKLLDEIEDGCGTKMSDLILAYLRRIFTWHASRVDDFRSPVVKGMGRYDAQANRGTRTLTDDELKKLWEATEPNGKSPQPFHALFRFLLLTGARRSEANEMTWDEIVGTDLHLPTKSKLI